MEKWRPALQRLDHKHGGKTLVKSGGKVSSYSLLDGNLTVMASGEELSLIHI